MHQSEANVAPAIDWAELRRTALGPALVAGVVGGALYVIGKMVEADIRQRTAVRDAAPAPAAGDEQTSDAVGEAPADVGGSECDADDADDDAVRAALLLGVQLDATQDQIRAALRAHLTFSRLHPDHGGDSEEAKCLIAAKNLLIERARLVRA